jgi:acetyl-CoA acetyltransferase
LRTPFVKAGREYAPHSSLELSVPVVQSMSTAARPDLLEAFSAQVIANVGAASDRSYPREKARVDFDTGAVPMESIDPHGGSVALGHPFAATGARILSQVVKE